MEAQRADRLTSVVCRCTRAQPVPPTLSPCQFGLNVSGSRTPPARRRRGHAALDDPRHRCADADRAHRRQHRRVHRPQPPTVPPRHQRARLRQRGAAQRLDRAEHLPRRQGEVPAVRAAPREQPGDRARGRPAGGHPHLLCRGIVLLQRPQQREKPAERGHLLSWSGGHRHPDPAPGDLRAASAAVARPTASGSTATPALRHRRATDGSTSDHRAAAHPARLPGAGRWRPGLRRRRGRWWFRRRRLLRRWRLLRRRRRLRVARAAVGAVLRRWPVHLHLPAADGVQRVAAHVGRGDAPPAAVGVDAELRRQPADGRPLGLRCRPGHRRARHRRQWAGRDPGPRPGLRPDRVHQPGTARVLHHPEGVERLQTGGEPPGDVRHALGPAPCADRAVRGQGPAQRARQPRARRCHHRQRQQRQPSRSHPAAHACRMRGLRRRQHHQQDHPGRPQCSRVVRGLAVRASSTATTRPDGGTMAQHCPNCGAP